MNTAVLNVVLVLSIMLVVNFSRCQLPVNVAPVQLSKLPIPSVEVLTSNSPFQVVFTLQSKFDCSTVVFTNPARGATNYTGTVVIARGSSVIVYEYAIASDGIASHATNCSTGEKKIWHVAAVNLGDIGGFVCFYSLNGTELDEFAFLSNNNEASSKIQDIVNLAKQLPNGNQIHDAYQNCPGRNGCQAF